MVQTLIKTGATKRGERQKQRKEAAKKVLTALIDDGMRQTDIAEYLGVTQAAISNNLHGVTTASVATLTLLVTLARKRNINLPEMLIWREL
jgi:transcriptional regulator with XRE-family HTH domain